MFKISKYLFAAFLVINIYAGEKSPADYVNPFICTQGDHGQWLPAAKVPFGMVELCADTYPGSLTANGNYAHGGYDYSDSQLRGFSVFHKGSSGGTRAVDRAGRLSFLPFTSVPSDTLFANPVVDFDKKSETAKPGYYSVKLVKDNILTELTATGHTASYRYTFPAGSSSKIFLSEGNRERIKSLTSNLINEKLVEGKLDIYNGTYFVIEFSAPVKKTSVWNGKELVEGNKTDKLHNGGLILEFGDLKGKAVEIRVGVSLISIENAKENLSKENPAFDFSGVRKKAFAAWNDVLSRISVKGNNDEYKTIFYTALYHTCFLPVTITDVNGMYPGLDEKIHKAEGYVHYDDYAFWDSFRTKYPLYSLFVPSVYKDIAKSLMDLYQQGNWDRPDGTHKPHGPGSGFDLKGKNDFIVFDNCRNEHMLMVACDAYFKGISGVDIKEMYPYLRREALMQMNEKYDKIGFIPERADETGEFSWDSWCVAQAAKAAGNNTDYDYFMKRANYWRNTWDPSIKYFRARSADGTRLDFPDDPAENREKYTYEGSKWHWRWNLLHDVPSLVDVMGGNENFTEQLQYFFEHDLYTAGNQPDLHAPYLFNFSGAPWLTQKWTYRILTQPILQRYGTHGFFDKPIFGRVYKNAPDGYLEEMDDDYGCMSSWYVLSAMGLYQVCPGNPVYQVTTPIFDEITIKLDSKFYKGKKFTVKAKNLSKDNYYIQSAMLNGKPFNRAWLNHDEITAGGELVLVMGPQPNKAWGVSK